MPDKSNRATEIITLSDIGELVHEAARFRKAVADNRPERIPQYRLALGLEPIHLGAIEFEILFVLAGRPYHPFTRAEIVAGVLFSRGELSTENVDQFVASLREQLGMFHDYVQSVPYIGYRFKA